MICLNHFYKRAVYAKQQFSKAVKNKKDAVEKYTGSEWDDAVYHLILLGKCEPKFKELADMEKKNRKLHYSDKSRVIETIYLAKSVEAMEQNLSSKVVSNKYHSLNLTVKFP